MVDHEVNVDATTDNEREAEDEEPSVTDKARKRICITKHVSMLL